MRFWLRILTFLFIAACLLSSEAISHADPRVLTRLSFLPNSGDLPLVEIQISDTIKGVFLIDTGSGGSFLTDTMVKRLGIELKPLEANDDPKMWLGIATVPHVQIGHFDLAIPFHVVPEKALNFFPNMHLDGVVGGNVLHNAAVLFDFAKRQITIWEEGNLGNFLLSGLGLLDKSAFNLPNTADNEYDFSISVRLNDQLTTNMLLDTGATSSCISHDVVQTLHLSPTRRENNSARLGGKSPSDQYHITSLALGPIAFQSDVFCELNPLVNQATKFIGRTFLTQFLVLFDYPAKKVYMRPYKETGTAGATAGSVVAKTYSWSSVYAVGQEFETEKSYTKSVTFPSGQSLLAIQTDRLKYHVKAGEQDGTSLLDISRSSTRLEMNGKLSPPDPMAYTSYTQVISKQGRLLKDSHTDGLTVALAQAVTVAENTPVPDHPIAIGDAWTSQIDNRITPGEKSNLTSTLMGEELVGGRPTLKVHISVSLFIKDHPNDTLFVDGYYNISTDTWQVVKREITISNAGFQSDMGEQGKGTIVVKEQVVPAKTETAPGKPDGK